MESHLNLLSLIILINIVFSFQQKPNKMDFSLKNLEKLDNARKEKTFLFNGASDDGQIFHINYGHASNVFGDYPNSGEEIIHAHEQNIIIPTQMTQDNSEILNLEKKLKEVGKRRRTLGRGFLSVKTDTETI